MFYIKLTDTKDLTITVREPIYRGENLHEKVIYLLPKTIGDIDVLSSYVYLNYIRPDGTPDIVILDRMEGLYNGMYLQYTFPITKKFTQFPGEVCTWLQIYTGDPSNPIVEKSGECMMHVLESKCIDQYTCDYQMTAIYQLHKTVEENIEKTEEAIRSKADNLMLTEDEKYIQLTANGNPIGDKISTSIFGCSDCVHVKSVEVDEDGNLLVAFSDGTVKNIGKVVGDVISGIYIPDISEDGVMTMTLSNDVGEESYSWDINPCNDWQEIEGVEGESSYVWEEI